MRLAFARVCCIALCAAFALAACGGNDNGGTAKRADGSDLEALPTPENTRGSVTGMPDEPGPGQPAAASTTISPDAFAVEDMPIDDENAPDEEGNVSGEPTTGDAVEVVQQYYASLESKDFPSAYAQWVEGASGQSPEQFAAGFADLAQIVVTADAPARMEGAVGNRYVEVPVAVETTSNDGKVRRFVGAYVLQRSVVDGATDAQRAWRIASADLRELTQ